MFRPTSLYFIVLLTLAVITTYVLGNDNCTSIDNCSECSNVTCNWVGCYNYEPSCQKNEVGEGCQLVPCDDTGNITTSSEATTTTMEPNITTTMEPDSTTTIQPETTTMEPDTTSKVPDTTTTSIPETTTVMPDPETTTVMPDPETTTVMPDPETTTLTPGPESTTTEEPETTTVEPHTTTEMPTTTPAPFPPSGRHFDAASFFGGMVLAVGIIAVGYATWHFYKSRNGRSYHTL